MQERDFSTRMQSVISSVSDRFTQVVRASRLNPATDFRYADLSCADLRGEDLRQFDFSHASFRGALVAGAMFNDTVKKRHLADAEKSSRAVVALIGNRLAPLEDRSQAYLGQDIVVPKHFTSAARMVGADQDRRRIETGVHLGDSSDLARKRMARPFRLHEHTIVNSRGAVILFEPLDDIDFDTLSAVRTRFQRAEKPAMIFLLPELMEDGGARETILNARLRQLPSEALIDMSVAASAFSAGISTGDDRVAHTRDRALGFLAMLPRTEAMISPPIPTGQAYDYAGSPWLLDGARRGRRGLYSAITSDLEEAEDQNRVGTTPDRRHVFIRRDLYDAVPAETLARTLTPRYGSCALAVFDPVKKSEVEYYVASGPSESPMWRLMI
jgi:hypothetical protein